MIHNPQPPKHIIIYIKEEEMTCSFSHVDMHIAHENVLLVTYNSKRNGLHNKTFHLVHQLIGVEKTGVS